MNKEINPIETENNPKDSKVEKTILANLLEALQNGGWNEELLQRTVKRLLEKNRQK